MPPRQLCTLFDSNYLARALVLYRSLVAHWGEFRLHAFCMDDLSLELLEGLALPGVVPVPVRELERFDPALAAVKSSRTAVEYCWTATPATCLYTLEASPDDDSVTYLDADLAFFADPAPLFAELGPESVLIVPHRYAQRHLHLLDASGIYNVGLLTFRRDENGLAVLRWWHDRCIDWCYARVEDGKFGDQKYLDDWPERFEGVHVLTHVGGGLAPWNAEGYALAVGDSAVTDDESRCFGPVQVDGVPLVFYHYHSLTLWSAGPLVSRLAQLDPKVAVLPGELPLLWRSDYSLGRAERSLVWDPYLRQLARELRMLRAGEPGASAGVRTLTALELARRQLLDLWSRAKLILRPPRPRRAMVDRLRRPLDGFDRSFGTDRRAREYRRGDSPEPLDGAAHEAG